MVKLVAMFAHPEDPAAFDEAYFGTHLPLNAKTPGLRRTEVTRVTGTPRGGESQWYLVTEMYYDDEESMRAAFASPEAAAAAKNLMSFAKGLVTMYTAEVIEEAPGDAQGGGSAGRP
jgi:uncharacterized protein (TIGR02118 family)